MSWRTGPAGERGKIGDHGQRGDTGDPGAAGPRGPAGADAVNGAGGPRGEPGVRGPRGNAARLNWPQTLAFVLIVVLGAVGFYETRLLQEERSQQRAEQTAELCQRTLETRETLREGLVGLGTEVAQLGRTLILDTPPPPTEEQERSLKAIEDFQTQIQKQVDALPPINCPDASNQTD